MLTKAELKRREGKLTASKVACIIEGDKARIYRLWEQMIGEKPEEYLEHVWSVRLGRCTENLNMDWYELKNSIPITRRNTFVVHPKLEWIACTLDGWETKSDCPFEAKHVSGREPIEIIRQRYYPQCQWQMKVNRVGQCALSVIMGAAEPVVEWIEWDEPYGVEMHARAERFMHHVWNKTPPVDLPEEPMPVEPIKTLDMTGNNMWASLAANYLETRRPHLEHEGVKLSLKAMVPADVRLAHGHGVAVTRNRKGVASIRMDKEGT